jgi:hypothetical protein
MTLKKCKADGCKPMLQIRGDMGEGDYADVSAAHRGQIFDALAGVPEHDTKDHYKYVEVDDANRDDFRICCLKCGKATGWRKESTDAPGAIKDFIVKQWNEGQ